MWYLKQESDTSIEWNINTASKGVKYCSIPWSGWTQRHMEEAASPGHIWGLPFTGHTQNQQTHRDRSQITDHHSKWGEGFFSEWKRMEMFQNWMGVITARHNEYTPNHWHIHLNLVGFQCTVSQFKTSNNWSWKSTSSLQDPRDCGWTHLLLNYHLRATCAPLCLSQHIRCYLILTFSHRFQLSANLML